MKRIIGGHAGFLRRRKKINPLYDYTASEISVVLSESAKGAGGTLLGAAK